MAPAHRSRRVRVCAICGGRCGRGLRLRQVAPGGARGDATGDRPAGGRPGAGPPGPRSRRVGYRPRRFLASIVPEYLLIIVRKRNHNHGARAHTHGLEDGCNGDPGSDRIGVRVHTQTTETRPRTACAHATRRSPPPLRRAESQSPSEMLQVPPVQTIAARVRAHASPLPAACSRQSGCTSQSPQKTRGAARAAWRRPIG